MTDRDPKAITGVLTLVPNPSTTRPCLPGMAFAIVVGTIPYFLCRNGKLLMSDSTWGHSAPALGTRVTAVGEVEEKRDVNACLFRTIEISSLRA